MVIHAGTPAVPAVATTYNWDATSLAHGSGPTFSIRSTDDNQDGLVQFGEEESGGFFRRTYLLFVMFYDQIEAVPVWSTQSLYTRGTAPEFVSGARAKYSSLPASKGTRASINRSRFVSRTRFKPKTKALRE